jgi:outer membrane protein assembly factor BamE (lipoprotein component of BamABCDE complex)
MPRRSHNCLVNTPRRHRGLTEKAFKDHWLAVLHWLGQKTLDETPFDVRSDLPDMDLAAGTRAPMWLVAACCATLLAGCSPSIEHRGYVAKPGAFGQISNGMAKSEVEGILGSPSTTASVNYQGDSYYYITSITKGRAFLLPKETNREVIAVRFDQNDQVQSFAQYGLEDGRVIDVNSRKTPVVGEDLSILQNVFRGVLNSKAGPGIGTQ